MTVILFSVALRRLIFQSSVNLDLLATHKSESLDSTLVLSELLTPLFFGNNLVLENLNQASLWVVPSIFCKGLSALYYKLTMGLAEGLSCHGQCKSIQMYSQWYYL